MKRLILAMALAGLSVAVSASPPPGGVGPPARGTPAQVPGKGDAALAAFRTALEQDGLSYLAGSVSTTDWAGQYCFGNRPNAGYVNKAPYLMIQVPRSADDSSQVENFKLRPDEAIVLIGPTPPPVKYFGYNTFLASRIFPDDPAEARRPLVATLGDAVNNATIRTTGPSPFGTPVVMIFTPDRVTDARIRAALRRSGYPSAMVNTMVFPSSLLKLGHGSTADELTLKMRIGMAEGDPALLEAYVKSAGATQTVYRVTPRTTKSASPFPVTPLRARGSGQTELDLMKTVDELREAIIAANPGLHTVEFRSKPVGYEGYDYIQQGVNPGADSRDNLFLAAAYIPEFGLNSRLTLADDEFLVVYGANHVATGKAAYASFNVYSSDEGKLSIGQVFHDQFEGTAGSYLPSGDPAVSMLYAYKVSRNCAGEPNCVTLSVDDCPKLAIGNDTVLGFFFRMYLEPATATGPAMHEIVYDSVIKFSPRAP
jgi:hypothetical protein